MPNQGWSGDLNAAKEFHASVHRSRDDDRRGRGSARGGRVSSNISRGGSVFANSPSFASNNNNNSNGRRGGLLMELPSYFWNPVNTTGTQNTQVANIEDRGDPMNIDDRGMASSQWASDSRTTTDPAATIQTGTGSVPTPASWGVAKSAHPGVSSHASSNSVRVTAPESSRPINSVRDRVAGPSQSQGMRPQAAIIDDMKGARDNFASEPQSRQQVTWGPRNTHVSSIKTFHSIIHGPFADQQLKDVQHSTIPAQGSQSAAPGEPTATQAGRQWPGLKASRHAGTAGTASTQGPAVPASHRQSGGPRRDLLQENGMLRGVQFTEDQGPQQDDDWLKTYNLNKVKDKCNVIAEQAFAAGDHEAEEALRKVATACNEVIRAKNELRDKKLEVEADKVLSKSQNAAWVHWIKFYRPDAPAPASSSTRALSDNSNVQMEDAPAVVSLQTGQVQTSGASIGLKPQPQDSQAASSPFASAQAPPVAQFSTFGAPESGSIDHTSSQQPSIRAIRGFDQGSFGGFGSSGSPKSHQSAAQQARLTTRPLPCDVESSGKNHSDGFDTSNPQQPQHIQRSQDEQQSTKLTGMPSMFPQGLPPGFDDPQARQIFEDFFFQNKRLPRK